MREATATVYCAICTFGAFALGWFAHPAPDRPAPRVVPAPAYTERCNDTGTFRVVIVPGTGIAMSPDPSCAAQDKTK